MIDLVHRLRRIAQMAGDDRRRALEDAVRADPRAGRALLEQHQPREVAAALMRLCAALGFESLDHAARLCAWCRLLGGAAGLAGDELDGLVLGAQVHDVGKLGVAAGVLGAADALTATELDWIRMHGSLGHALLAGVPGLEPARELVLHHHEYWNGTGYPEGRRGPAIPRAARVFVLVDSYEAMVRDDVAYRACRDHAAARDELIELAGVRYDPELVALWRTIDRARWEAVAERDTRTTWAA
ncbi:MAG TPA: HD domain-containing phosphohydrolase [Kofleriaceae bacterium]|nr:HD domain-containing phosphohydrolase [Kofleriaceae bacterium]